MWRSEPQIPLASTRTIASSGEVISGSGTSSTRTSPGAWKVTARMAGAYRRAPIRSGRGGGRPKERCDAYREVAAGPDHGLLNRDREEDGGAAGGRRLERARNRAQARVDRGPGQGGLQGARA